MLVHINDLAWGGSPSFWNGWQNKQSLSCREWHVIMFGYMLYCLIERWCLAALYMTTIQGPLPSGLERQFSNIWSWSGSRVQILAGVEIFSTFFRDGEQIIFLNWYSLNTHTKLAPKTPKGLNNSQKEAIKAPF